MLLHKLRHEFRIQIPSNLVNVNLNLLTSSWRLSNINFQVPSAQLEQKAFKEFCT